MPRNSLFRRGGSRTTPALGVDALPVLAAGVAFERTADEAVWIAMLHGVPASRVSSSVVDLLTAMNGETALHDLYTQFAASDSWDGFVRLVQRFGASGLLEGDTPPPPGRVTYRPPFTLQLATLRAPALFDRLDRLTIPLPRKGVLTAIVAALCAGVVAAVLQASELTASITTPMPLTGLVGLVVALSFLTFLHESAHGLTLTRFGGRPRRAGFMIFYLTPAFFVDVTDGWRLDDRRQRVMIALAGPAVHAVVSAVALTTALAIPDPAIRQTLMLLALSCAAIVLVNLIPFVRFDGYIALMSALDEPNLRGRAIRDGADFLSRVLFGGRRPAKRLDRWWSVPFGLASLLAPILLVLFAVSRIAGALAGGGPILGLFVVVLEVAVLLVGVGLVFRALQRALRTGVPRVRFVSVVAALVASLVLAGALIPVPLSATFGYSSVGGRVILVDAEDAIDAGVPDGAPVALMSNGILVDVQLGAGTVRPRRPEPTTVPVDALFPVRVDGVSIPATIVAEVDVTEGSVDIPSTGRGRIDLGTSSLWQALWTSAVSPSLSALRNEK